MPRGAPIEDRVDTLEELEAHSWIQFKLMVANARRAIELRHWSSARSYLGRAQDHALTREQDHECNVLHEKLVALKSESKVNEETMIEIM